MAGFLFHDESGVAVFWMQKSGCTLLKNLFFKLATGESYPNPVEVHSDKEACARISFRPKKHRIDPENAFVVVRDPTARILSFYWDKVHSRGPYSMPRLRRKLGGYAGRVHDGFQGFSDKQAVTLDEHRETFAIMLDAIELAFAEEDGTIVNDHFALQSQMIFDGRAQGLPKVALEDLPHGIPPAITKRLPELASVFKGLPRMNESVKQFRSDEILTPELTSKINRLYQVDIEMYSRSLAGTQRRARPSMA